MLSNGKYCHYPNDVPDTEHWAILEGESVTIPGDERSRTHPGHGYPESTENYITYRAFTDKESFETEMRRLHSDKHSYKTFKGIHVLGAVKATIKIEFNT